jgi:Cu2+-exporting ATPase
VINALRLNFINVTKPARVRKNKKITAQADMVEAEEEGDKNMTKTMNIEGMMCPHCSGRVKKCLEALDGVASAEVSHESGTAVIKLCGDISAEALAKVVEAEGYRVI